MTSGGWLPVPCHRPLVGSLHEDASCAQREKGAPRLLLSLEYLMGRLLVNNLRQRPLEQTRDALAELGQDLRKSPTKS